MKENKISKYLLYALGEIALVMIGILLALQVNNWNAQRIQNKEIASKYSGILEELRTTSELVHGKAHFIDSIIVGRNQRSLQLLQLKNEDSIQTLYESLRGISNVITVAYEMPATSEFLEEGYASKIKNLTLKDFLLKLKRSLSFGNKVDDYAQTQLNTLIEPYMVRHLNYAQMLKGRKMIAINETKDFSQFFDDMQLENLINLKIETDITKVDYLLTLGNLLDATKEEIEKELQGVSEVEE
ncbi:hypothetical protein [Aureisphaera sp.]